MAEERAERRLAAILAADVVGYSGLVERDEAGTISAFKAHLASVIEPSINHHRGRIVKTLGDGVLAEFASAVDAVLCASAIQGDMAQRNADVPDDRRLRLRIGINVGDIIIDGDDILGDGVNIAARLEGIAEPGGICISGTVYDQVHGKLDTAFADLGERSVKNIERPIRAYKVLLDGPVVSGQATSPAQAPLWRRWPVAAAAAVIILVAGGVAWWQPWVKRVEPASIERMAFKLPDKPSIAVLPFDNLSGDPKQDYLADGITEDLITDLSRIRDAFVIARSTSFTYKGKSVNARDVAKELNVRYVLEGSVRRSGDQVRVNAQLVDGKTGADIWSDRFDRKFKNVFSLQNEVTGRIAAVLRRELLEAESRRLKAGPPRDLQAWDYALRAWATLVANPVGEEKILEVQRILKKAMALDPNSALAWTAMARVYASGATSGWGTKSKAEARRLMLEAARKAVALDPKSADAYRQLGFAYRFHRQFKEAESACQTALNLNPNLDDAYLCLAMAKVATGEPRKAIPLFEKAVRLNPREPRTARRNFFIGLAHLMAGNYDKSIDLIQKGIAANPRFPAQYWVLASALGHLGRIDEARTALTEFNRVDKHRRDTIAKMRRQYDYLANFERAVEGLRRAGMPEK